MASTLLQQKEAELAAKLRQLMVSCDAVGASSSDVAAQLAELEDELSTYAFTISEHEQQAPAAGEDDGEAGGEDAGATFTEAIEGHRAQWRHFSRQVARVRRGHAAEPQGGGGDDGASLGRSARPLAASTPPASRAAARVPAPPDRAASLRVTRDMLDLELQRMAAATELLAKDATALSGTLEEHVGYGTDAVRAGSLAALYAHREARDKVHIRAAFALFLAVSAYIMARRTLWTFFGVRLPGL